MKTQKEKVDLYTFARPKAADVTAAVSKAFNGLSNVSLAVAHGMGMARALFRARGNKTEVHLGESDLATICACAVQRGYLMGKADAQRGV